MNREEMRQLARTWLAPMDSSIADLIDKSNRMTIGAFEREVEAFVERIPQMYPMLDKRALENALFEAMSEAAAKKL
jgi:hypothetical protein